MAERAATLAVVAEADQHLAAAEILAAELALDLLPPGTDPASVDVFEMLLQVSDAPLALRLTGPGAPGPVAADFGSGGMRHRRRGGQNELLGRAVGVSRGRRPVILDATAGLGRDSFVLADLGCEVLLCERSTVLCALLESGMSAAAASGDDWLQQVSRRMTLWRGDCRELPESRLGGIEVIYLDPMFPARDKSARVKKEMELLQQLLPPIDDAGLLLDWALALPVARVVVKRPSRAAELACRAPSHTISGKAVRYDVYVHRALAAD